MFYFYIRLQNGLPIERSVAFWADELPEITEGWDEVWTEEEWIEYVMSIPEPVVITPENATQVSDFYEMTIDNYELYRNHLLLIVEALGGGNEEDGFNTLNILEQEFVALNGIGSSSQIQSVLVNPTKQTLEFLTIKQLL